MDGFHCPPDTQRRFIQLKACPTGQYHKLTEDQIARYSDWMRVDVLQEVAPNPGGSVWMLAARPKEAA